MIKTLEIPTARWSELLALLERQLRDRIVRLEVIGSHVGDQDLAEARGLRSLAFEPRGSEHGSVTITVGDEDEEIEHRVPAVSRIYLALGEGGRAQWLAIEEPSGEKTLLHFEQLPELPAELLPTT